MSMRVSRDVSKGLTRNYATVAEFMADNTPAQPGQVATAEGLSWRYVGGGETSVQGKPGWVVDVDPTHVSGRQYPTREAFVADTDYAPADGAVVTFEGRPALRQTGATALPGLPNYIPARDVYTPEYFGSGANGWQEEINLAIEEIDDSGRGALVLTPFTDYVAEDSILVRGNQTIDGRGATIRLASWTTNPPTLIKSNGFEHLIDTSASVGTDDLTLQNLNLDGGYTVGTSAVCGEFEGIGLAVYGRLMRLENVKIRNFRGVGLYTEYSGPQSPQGHQYSNVLVENTGRTGWRHGVSDSHSVNFNVRSAARAGEADHDGIELARFLRATNLNVWNPGAGANVGNMRYALNARAGAAYIYNATLEHGRDACLHVGPSNTNFDIQANCHTVRGEGNPVILLRGRSGRLRLTLRPGTVFPNAPLLQLGQTGDGATSARGNIIEMSSRDTSPSSVINVVQSNGRNTFIVGGQVDTVAPLVSGELHPTDTIVGKIINAGTFGTNAPRPYDRLAEITTTDATETPAVIPLQDLASYLIAGRVLARQTAGSNFGRRDWSFRVHAARGNGVSTVAFIGTPTVDSGDSFAAVAWDFNVAANTTTGNLELRVTGEAEKTIRWLLDFRVTEIKQ